MSRHRRARNPRVLIAISFVVLATALAAVGWALWSTDRSDGVPAFATEAPVMPARPVPLESAAPLVRPPATETSALTDEFAELQDEVGGVIGVAIAPVGGSAPAMVIGEWASGPAWSTIKVPLAVAAFRETEPPQITSAITAAITQSDNAAAESIWAQLGNPALAAQKVGAVLAEAGDPTAVQSERVRPEFTAFGQTDWSLENQTRYASFAACMADDTPVLDLMSQVQNGAGWGLGVIAGAQFKGGWGPSEDGTYLVRQFGLITTDRGTTAVALAAQSDSGSFADGTDDLTTIANWLMEHVEMLPTGRCGS